MSIHDMTDALESLTEKSLVLENKILRLQAKLDKLKSCHDTVFQEYERRMNTLLEKWRTENFFKDDEGLQFAEDIINDNIKTHIDEKDNQSF
jgi:hypothetical protein